MFLRNYSPAYSGGKQHAQKVAITGKFENYLAVFQEKAIPRLWHNEEWWLVIADVVAFLTTRFNQMRISRIDVVTRSWMSLYLPLQTAVSPPRAGARHESGHLHPGLPPRLQGAIGASIARGHK